MSKLIHELQRLYFLPEQPWYHSAAGDTLNPASEALSDDILAATLAGEPAVALNLIGADERVRTLVVRFSCAADWALVSAMYQGLQEDLELPAPAISVSGRTGYRLWLSLAESVPAAQARLFLEGLRARYLADVAPSRFMLLPSGQCLLSLVPACHGGTGKWSAFIDPSMVAMFADEPGLEMAPNMDRQADLLAGLKSIAADEFGRAMAALEPIDPGGEQLAEIVAAWSSDGAPHEAPAVRQGAGLAGNYSDPRGFLLAVMNDPACSIDQRIEAARALLPFFGKTGA